MQSDCENVPGQRPQVTWKRVLLTVAVLGFLLVVLGMIAGGKSGAEKTMIRLVQPIGFGWLVFTAFNLQYTLVSGLRRASMTWLIWFVLMFFTTTTVRGLV